MAIVQIVYNFKSWFAEEWYGFIRCICLTKIEFTFSCWAQILPSSFCFISDVFFSCKGWCLCDFLLPLIHLPFLIKCSLCWKIKLNRFLWFSFPLPVARSKGQLMYRIICLLFPSWSMKNQRANLYSCATRNIMEIYLTWSNVRQVISKGSVPHCYKKSTRNFMFQESQLYFVYAILENV